MAPAPKSAPPPAATPESWAQRLIELSKFALDPIGTAVNAIPGVQAVNSYIATHPARSAAVGAGILSAPFTEGMSIPAAMAVTGGAGTVAAGGAQAVSDLASGKTPGRDVVTEGLTEGLPQALGPAVGAGIGAATRGVMKIAQGASARLAAEFPTLSQTAIDNAIAISKGGLDKARQLLSQAKGVVRNLLASGDQANLQVPVKSATDGLLDALNPNSADVVGDMNTLARIEREITQSRGATMTPSEADALKANLQARAKAAYAARAAGNNPNAISVEAQGYQKAAAALNQGIDDSLSSSGFKGYRDANGDAQQMIGQMKAIRVANARNTLGQILLRTGVGTGVGGAVGYGTGEKGGAIEGALTGLALTPANLSRLAIMLGSPSVKLVLSRLAPASVGAFVKSLIGPTSSASSEPSIPDVPITIAKVGGS